MPQSFLIPNQHFPLKMIMNEVGIRDIEHLSNSHFSVFVFGVSCFDVSVFQAHERCITEIQKDQN